VIFEIRQHKPDKVILSECFTPDKGINPSASEKTVRIILEVLIVFPTAGGTSSCDGADMVISWHLQGREKVPAPLRF
jgi:hypothetical protein